MNRRLEKRVLAALHDAGVVGTGHPAAWRVFYRRAVPTEARAALAPPTGTVAGVRTVPSGDVVLVAADFPGGRLDVASVDAALHAARAAGATWAIASVTAPEDVAVLRELAFQPFGGDGDEGISAA